MTKLHPLTALRDALAYGARLGGFGFFVGVIGSGTELGSPLLFALAPLGFLAGAAYGVARYQAFEYELGETTLAIRSGVVQRQAREIPLGRVQNVDVEESFLQRLFGLAVVRFETAGGGATEGELRLVSATEAQSLQAELRRRKRVARADAEGDAGDGGEAAGVEEPEPTVLYELSTRDLLVLSAVSFRWGVVPVLLFSTPLVEDLMLSLFRRIVVEVVLGGELSLTDPRLLLVALGVGAAYVLLAWVLGAVITIARYYDFQLARLDDELVYERGLFQRYSGTVPLDKVQTLAVEENVAMRRLGYAALTIETAGYAPGGDGSGQRSPSAIPLAPRTTVLSLVRTIEGVDDVGVERPPRRARRRYAGRFVLVVLGISAVFAAVHTAVRPLGVLWALPLALLVGALPAAHLRWANRGHRTGEHHLLTRTGFWRRSTRVVPYYRLQTVLTERTVFQRRFDLASVVGDTAASSTLRSRNATAFDVDDGDARALHARLRDGLLEDLGTRRAGRRPERAATTVGADDPTTDDAHMDDGQVQEGDAHTDDVQVQEGDAHTDDVQESDDHSEDTRTGDGAADDG